MLCHKKPGLFKRCINFSSDNIMNKRQMKKQSEKLNTLNLTTKALIHVVNMGLLLLKERINGKRTHL